MKGRRFLFLQGVCSPFFPRLAEVLRREGASVRKIHFNMGDMAYWRRGESEAFRGDLAALPEFMRDRLRQHRITDVLLFGDCRPVHRLAIAEAKATAVRCHVLEEGYFRPWWFTLERDGVNRYSRLPRDPLWYREVAKRLPPAEAHQPFTQAFAVRAFHDVLYHLAGALNPVGFPRYRTHAAHLAPREYAGYVWHFLYKRLRQRADQHVVDDFLSGRAPYFLLPLQLNHDAQIREHSPFANMPEVLRLVMKSFAHAAPPTARLLIKNHPLDYGTVDYARLIAGLVREFALEGRVACIESGPLAEIVERSAGVVTVNSTVGAVALDHGRPLITLGDAIYRLPGLSFAGPLDDFWQHAAPAEPALYEAFRRVVMHATQINGGFYSRGAIAVGLAHIVPALAAIPSRLERLLQENGQP
jgi:capsular polysaccharide export protein